MIVFLTQKDFEKLMTSLQQLTNSINKLTTAVALIPTGPPSTTGDPGLTAAQALAASAAIDAQTAILTADVATTTPPAGVPAAPTAVTATSAGGGIINLSLPAVPGATGYTLNQSTTTGAEVASPAVAVIPATGPVTFSVSGLAIGTAYFFTVTALNAAGASAPSAEITLAA